MTPFGFFLAALSVLLVGLKLTGHIAWSWWLVLLPIYGPGVVAVLVMIIAAGLMFK